MRCLPGGARVRFSCRTRRFQMITIRTTPPFHGFAQPRERVFSMFGAGTAIALPPCNAALPSSRHAQHPRLLRAHQRLPLVLSLVLSQRRRPHTRQTCTITHISMLTDEYTGDATPIGSWRVPCACCATRSTEATPAHIYTGQLQLAECEKLTFQSLS